MNYCNRPKSSLSSNLVQKWKNLLNITPYLYSTRKNIWCKIGVFRIVIFRKLQ